MSSNQLQTPKEYKFTSGVVFQGKIKNLEYFLKFDSEVNKKEFEGQMSSSCFHSEGEFILIEMFDCKFKIKNFFFNFSCLFIFKTFRNE